MTPDSLILEYGTRPFRYGDDCCQFVAEFLKLETGKDYAAEFEYDDEDGASSILERHGGLEGLFRYVFGQPSKDGNVCICTMANGEDIAGVVYLGQIIVRTENGITNWPISRGRLFWRA